MAHDQQNVLDGKPAHAYKGQGRRSATINRQAPTDRRQTMTQGKMIETTIKQTVRFIVSKYFPTTGR